MRFLGKEKHTACKAAMPVPVGHICSERVPVCTLSLLGLEVKIHQESISLISTILWLQFTMESLVKSLSAKTAVRNTLILLLPQKVFSSNLVSGVIRPLLLTLRNFPILNIKVSVVPYLCIGLLV